MLVLCAVSCRQAGREGSGVTGSRRAFARRCWDSSGPPCLPWCVYIFLRMPSLRRETLRPRLSPAALRTVGDRGSSPETRAYRRPRSAPCRWVLSSWKRKVSDGGCVCRGGERKGIARDSVQIVAASAPSLNGDDRSGWTTGCGRSFGVFMAWSFTLVLTEPPVIGRTIPVRLPEPRPFCPCFATSGIFMPREYAPAPPLPPQSISRLVLIYSRFFGSCACCLP